MCDDMRQWRCQRQGMQRALAEEHRVRGAGVKEWCTGFNQARLDLARAARQQRLRFVAVLRRSVEQQRQGMQADLAGAQRAWGGRS